jgi:manganese oxidase
VLFIHDEPVVNEEQHHSSWMFGDPATPVLKAYLGDPVRIRLVHAGVKETHVFHLHLYGWHHDPDNHRSPVIDAISITPQTGHTIVPLYGAGNVQSVPGDSIFHCHLYPHFHMGMWGMLRAFDTEQEGRDGPPLAEDGPYAGRRVGRYPDGTRIERLAVLPDRQAPPPATAERPGFPLFVPGRVGPAARQGSRSVPVTSTTTSPPTRARPSSISATSRLGRPISTPWATSTRSRPVRALR